MNRTIGLLGGGQLGQMLCEAANPLGIKVVILDAENSPAKQVNAKNAHIVGAFTDPEKIRELARQVDILTVEIEHVNTQVLEEVETQGVEIIGEDGKMRRKMVEVQPSWRTIRVIQDKFAQKLHLASNNIATAESIAVDVADLEQCGRTLGYPFMLKARKDAYDGRGNYPVRSPTDLEDAVVSLKGRDLYAEKWAEFRMELAVMVVKTSNDASGSGGNTIAYPAVETVHEDSICKLVYSPGRNTSSELLAKAQDVARKTVGSLWGKGVFCVELFVMSNDEILVNEIAPRPHNSGHFTIEACPISQYKAQLLSILGIMPEFPNNVIPSLFPAAMMLNILGGAGKDSHEELVRRSMVMPNTALHLYGKEAKPARKIGHITLVSSSITRAQAELAPLIELADAMRAERKHLQFQKESIESSSMTVDTVSAIPASLNSGSGPRIVVTMGSDSDLPVLKPGLALLTQLDIPFHVTITSAHRTPHAMIRLAETAVAQGYKVIIAAAGGAAHLPGMIAASTPLPVIGVPVKASTLDGMDSLLSIVQMPRGVPVATVAINNSINAALLAARILGTTDSVIFRQLEIYMKDMESEVTKKAKALERDGYIEYKGLP